ncbi:hypothetical protein [Sulfurospirillum arcachonense]|uniref:hypothetical protein n=1 Tax=Sulfurospirillum arcachonense TaxID=57666 RepID=UPI000467F6C9|nr:hypothetical protein [Sulfurospirillum arcachonense]
MVEDKIYLSVLDYMCANYDYSLYATDFNAQYVSAMQRSIASVNTTAGGNRISSIKTALQDFFNAIFQKVFVYEDEERLKIVKYFDNGAVTEEQDKQIHAFRLELVKYKEDVELSFKKDSLYMFDKATRKCFEMALVALNEIPQKNILREQISLVYSLDRRDIVIFLNEKIFLKRFHYFQDKHVVSKNKEEILYDKRFVDSLWEEVRLQVHESFKNGFDFIKYDAKDFYNKYPQKFFSIVKLIVKNSFEDISESDTIQYSNIVFKNYLPKMLEEVANYIFQEVLENELKAIIFLKYYSESTSVANNKLKLNKAPLMDKKGKIYKYQNILALLKHKELLDSKITHKKIELKNIQTRVQKSLRIVERSEDEMESIQKRRLELLIAIEKVEDDINSLTSGKITKKLDISRLEFAKRDLLDAFKQVEIRLRTQTNILNNTNKELDKWEEKRSAKNLLKESLVLEYANIEEEYKNLCSILATALSKEPLDL